MAAGCAGALPLLLALVAVAAAQQWQPGDRLSAFSVSTLAGTLHVGGKGAAAAGRAAVAPAPAPAGRHVRASGPLLVVCYDAAHPGSRAMWREPASLDALLKDAPAEAQFLLLPLNETSAADDAAWMRRQLQQRAAALQLAPAGLGALLARLHFATKGLAALEGPLPALLREQWQELWPAVLAVPVGFSGDAADLERVAGPAPVGLPAPQAAEAANSSEEQPGGQQLSGSTASGDSGARAPGGRRALRAVASNVTSDATQAMPSAPRLVAYTLEASSLWVYERLASRDANLSLVLAGTDCRWLPQGSVGGPPAQPPVLRGAAALVTLSQWPSNDPAAPCSWHALLMGAAQAGAAAVLFAAPPGTGPDLQEPACAGSSSAPCGSPAIAAATVGHRFGRALRLALGGSRRVNVTFGGVRGPAMFAGILPDGRLFEVGAGSSVTPSLAAAVWEAQGRAYLQRVEARARGRRAAPGSLAVPIFHKALLPPGAGVRAAVQMPSAARLAGLDRLELDMQLGCPGARENTCPEWDHVVQLYVCCNDPGGAAPRCDPCRNIPWSLPAAQAAAFKPRSLSLGVAPGSSSSGSSGGGSSSSTANVTARAIKDGSDSGLPSAQLVRQCGRELGRWVTPYRRGIGRWLTDVTPLRPLLVPGQQCTFTMQSTDQTDAWKPSLTLLFSSSKAATVENGGSRNATIARGSGSGSGGGSSGRSTQAVHAAPAPRPAPAATRSLPSSVRVAISTNSTLDSGFTLVGGQAQPVLPAAGSGGTSHPARLLPLTWPGGNLDAGYNRRQLPFQFETPAGLRQALLVATITGHGQDRLYNCAEFCPVQHLFTVNGAQHNVTHAAAGTLFGCADQVGEGTVPNQLGTWTLGRAGWCPGREVAPWVADVSHLLLAEGELNMLEYRALLPGGKEPGTPPDALPQDLAANGTALAEQLRSGSGSIRLEASLVLYTAAPG